MSSQYKELLSSTRLRPSTVESRSILLEAESDRGRLLFCAAFRRLQQKAQVFSMEPNAAVRSRLTHSLEVSQMGRYISDQISLKLIEEKLATSLECSALTTFVETACLMHDIGNPPFGHFGESAISEWFHNNGTKIAIKSCFADQKTVTEIDKSAIAESMSDFLEFDGNPQGIRVVTRLQRNSDEFGLNISKTTIAAYLKYIRGSGEKQVASSPFTKKCGYFTTEKDIVLSVWDEFGYTSPQRFPLAYIMEAADDIAYCISDLEDSIEKGLLNQEIAIRDIHKQWKESEPGEDSVSKEIEKYLCFATLGKTEHNKPFTYTDFRTSLNRILVQFSAEQYIKNHNDILSGTLPSLIPSKSPAGKILEALKAYCKKRVYRHTSVQKIELAGYRAIYGLLDQFSCLLIATEDRFKCALNYQPKDNKNNPIIIESKILSLFPKNYIKVYKDQLAKLDSECSNYKFLEWNLRAHLITDFISGMTDDFVIKTYQTLNGIKI